MLARPPFHHKRSEAGDVSAIIGFFANAPFASGSVLFADGSGNLQQDNANLFFDNSTNQLKANSLHVPTSIELGHVSDTTLARSAAGRISIEGLGIVKGPASSTDNSIPRFNSTTGELIKSSSATISDNGGISSFGTESGFGSFDRDLGGGASVFYRHNGIVRLYDSVFAGDFFQFTASTGAYNFLGAGVSSFAGDITISKAVPTLTLNHGGSTNRNLIRGLSNGSQRWEIQPGNATAESGSNAGSDFAILRYSDAGSFIDSPFAIIRSSGSIVATSDLFVIKSSPSILIADSSGVGQSSIYFQEGGLNRWSIRGEWNTVNVLIFYNEGRGVIDLRIANSNGNATFSAIVTMGAVDLTGSSAPSAGWYQPIGGTVSTPNPVESASTISPSMGTSGTKAAAIAKANVQTTASTSSSGDKLSYTIPANSLSAAGKGIRMTAWGTTNGTAALTVVFGGTTIFTFAFLTAGAWYIDTLVFSTGTDTQDYVVRMTSANAISQMHVTLGSTTIDDGAGIIIKVTSDAGDIQEGMLVEYFG